MLQYLEENKFCTLVLLSSTFKTLKQYIWYLKFSWWPWKHQFNIFTCHS